MLVELLPGDFISPISGYGTIDPDNHVGEIFVGIIPLRQRQSKCKGSTKKPSKQVESTPISDQKSDSRR